MKSGSNKRKGKGPKQGQIESMKLELALGALLPNHG